MSLAGDQPVESAAPHEAIRIPWASPFPATLQDASFHLIDVNAAYVEFTGYAREALIGIDPIGLQPEEDRASSIAARALLEEGEVKTVFERRIVDAHGRERWFRAARHVLRAADGSTLIFSLLQDSTAEHVARERADRSARELDNWFDLSPLGMVLFDARGLLVRTNAAFEALAGEVPVQLSDASESLQQLLGWGHGEALAALQPDSGPLEGQAFVPQADGGLRRLRSIVRCYRTMEGHHRYMAAVEDRSVEEERDLAQMQIGAMMDTAGVALATFQESLGLGAPAACAEPGAGRARRQLGGLAVHQPRHRRCPNRCPNSRSCNTRCAMPSAPSCATRCATRSWASAGCSRGWSRRRWPRASAPPRSSRST